jgi:hypothetical protein
MINDSTLTAADIRDRLTSEKSESIRDATVRYGLNDLINMVDRFRWDNDKSGMRTETGGISIDSSGYDLSLITDLGDTEIGFQVYMDTLEAHNQLNLTDRASRDRGYYIQGGKLYITPTPTGTDTFYVVYMKKSDQIMSDTALDSFSLPFPRQLDSAVYRYISSVFYDGEFQFDQREDQRRLFMEELRRVFTNKKRVVLV